MPWQRLPRYAKNDMTDIKLTRRLQAAADLVREGAMVADVGTDHAYLPIALCQSNRAASAVASDINEGPIARAREHVAEYGMSERIATVRCDGLSELEGYHPTDVLILGMGGELIADIVRRAPWTKTEGLRLILQPMTHPEVVRRFLCENGYTIVEECLVSEGKLYQLMAAEYTGNIQHLSPLALLIGEGNLRRGDALTRALCERFCDVFAERLRGKRMAKADTTEEENMLRQLEEYLS